MIATLLLLLPAPQYPLPSPDLCLLIHGGGVCSSSIPAAPAGDCLGAVPEGCYWEVDGPCYEAAAAERQGNLLSIRQALCNVEEDGWMAFWAELGVADQAYLRCMENAVLPHDYLQCRVEYDRECERINREWREFRDALVAQWGAAVAAADAEFLAAFQDCCRVDCPPATWQEAYVEATRRARILAKR